MKEEVMSRLWIVPIEPLETRYTKHWYTHLPEQIAQNTLYKVEQIEVPLLSDKGSEGGFLNFSETMAYKARQAEVIANLFCNKKVLNGDIFLYTDYWNPTVHNVRYMASLNSIDVKIVGICHAGNWDPHDILSQKVENKRWIHDFESSLNQVYDLKIFATEFSKNLYQLSYRQNFHLNKVTGFPMEYYDEILTPYWEDDVPIQKEDIVVFPHRKSPEKNLDLFLKIKKLLPQYEFLVCLDECKTKEEYHSLLKRSKVAFSASWQETLGISMGIEALRCGNEVLVPNWLSYKEMNFDSISYYDFEILYNDKVTKILAERIEHLMSSWNIDRIKRQHDKNFKRFFNGKLFYRELVLLND